MKQIISELIDWKMDTSKRYETKVATSTEHHNQLVLINGQTLGPSLWDINDKEKSKSSQKSTSNYCKQLWRLLIFLAIPIRIFTLYYMDILSDVMQAASYYSNCHFESFVALASILASSYFITAIYIKIILGMSWSKAIWYPWVFE